MDIKGRLKKIFVTEGMWRRYNPDAAYQTAEPRVETDELALRRAAALIELSSMELGRSARTSDPEAAWIAGMAFEQAKSIAERHHLGNVALIAALPNIPEQRPPAQAS